MKKITYLLLTAVFIVTFAWSCEDKGNTNTNEAPTCKITEPADNDTFKFGEYVIIKADINDPDDNIASVVLKFDETAMENVTLPVIYRIPSKFLTAGEHKVSLYVEDEEGLSDEDEITITVLEQADADIVIEPSTLEFGYWTEESEVSIITENSWTMTIPDRTYLSVYDDKKNEWSDSKIITGTGNTTLKVRQRANEKFETHSYPVKVITSESSVELRITQEESPDMMMMLEDEMLRWAASISIVIYGVDIDEDGKVSAYEAETDPGIFGFDAGGWGVESVKGIEYFPHLKHLDVNTNPDLTEVDLSGNPNIMSLHLQGTGITNIDLTPVPRLIEIGCNHSLYLNIDLEPFKTQMHTIAVLNRKPEEPSTLDFSGYTNLSRLYVYENGLTELNLSGCKNLWLLSAHTNLFTELDLSDVDRDPDNMYFIDKCPDLEVVYVWRGWTKDYYSSFAIDDGVRIEEK